jgi:bifunctional polynucleotide phosphatase/kinase
VSTRDDECRKPRIGMWHHLLKENPKLDLASSLFVGDADGSRDSHECSDRKFAMNIGLRFFTPEMFFLGRGESKFQLDGFDPNSLIPGDSFVYTPGEGKQAIMLVGPPNSGKTFYSNMHFASQKKIQYHGQLSNAFEHNEIVIIDDFISTFTPLSRKAFIEWCNHACIPITCLHFSSSYEQSLHLWAYGRHYYKDFNYVSVLRPSLNEGFVKVVDVPFSPMFQTEEDKERFFLRLT